MSVLSTFTALPNRFSIALEYIHSYGEKGLDRQVIKNHLQIEGDSIVQGNLSELIKLDILKENSNKNIVINNDISNLLKKINNPYEALYPILCQKLTNSNKAKLCGQTEVPLTIAFLLSISSYEPLEWSGTSFFERMNKEMVVNNDLFDRDSMSDAWFQNLAYWTRYLGFSNLIDTFKQNDEFKKHIIPDPTEAIDKHLSLIFSSKKLPIKEFHDLLGNILPVLEGGGVRDQLESNLRNEFKRKEGYFSKSTSLAIKRLEMRNKIKLEKVSDTMTWILDLGQDHEQITHIEYIS